MPGTKGLTLLPSSLTGLLRSPLLGLLSTAVLRDLVLPSNREKDLSDESVDSFLSRRFGKRFAQDFGSALVHGIYASDSRMISVRAAFPSLWQAHLAGGGSVARGMLRSFGGAKTASPINSYELGGVPNFMSDVSVFSFREGLSTLSRALREAFSAQRNIEVLRAQVECLLPPDKGKFNVRSLNDRYL